MDKWKEKSLATKSQMFAQAAFCSVDKSTNSTKTVRRLLCNKLLLNYKK